MSKLPYIPNKKLYAAVMGACSWIRESGYFNKATRYYADKYGVDVDDVRKYVRIAQGNGQKQANKYKKRKYKYWAIEYSIGGERFNNIEYFEKDHAQYSIEKATSKDNAMSHIDGNDRYWDEWAPQHFFGRCEPFDTKEQAKEQCEAWKKEAAK